MNKRRVFHRSPRKPPGTPPGTLVAPEGAPKPVITVMAYNQSDLLEKELEDLSELPALREKWDIVWVNVIGLGSVELIEEIGSAFSLHPLALEDILELNQRPKVEEYEDSVFAVLRMATLAGDELDIEQVSLCFGENFVVSFQERPGDCLEPVRARIRKGSRRLRLAKADYLTYALIDAIVDGYFPILEAFGNRLEDLEEDVIVNPSRSFIAQTHAIKRELQALRHAIWPMREALNAFSLDMKLIESETRFYLRDCQDHIIQVIDIIETFRERASGLVDIYLSSLSNKMNEIMKVLTIIATIFIPLSFITGIYGMNFNTEVSPLNMPELNWYLGYPFALGMMAIVAALLVLYFWRKGWLKESAKRPDKALRDK